jgi:integrase/recombinase XerD
MGYSAKILQRSKYSKSDGTAAIYLQVIIDRKVKFIHLDLFWPLDKFDQASGSCKKRTAKDQDVGEMNIILQDCQHKANQIFKRHLLQNKKLTIDRFDAEYRTGSNDQSFTIYLETKSRDRLKNGEISYTTYQNHLKTLTKLKAYKKDVSFADMDERWAYEFDAWMQRTIKSRGNTQNTRWAQHKNIKTYLHQAQREDIQYEDPYKYFTISLVESSWKSIHERDVGKLYREYKVTDDIRYRRILRRFLFAVATGLRKSDLYRIDSSWLSDGMMTFIPHKTRRKNKRLSVPLSRMALDLFNEALADKGPGLLFDDYEEQYSNRVLKKIGVRLGIKENLHHHIGRHTFITLYLKNGGKIDIAKELAGHSEIKTTMGYNHVSEETKKSEIKYIDEIMSYFSEPSDLP